VVGLAGRRPATLMAKCLISLMFNVLAPDVIDRKGPPGLQNRGLGVRVPPLLPVSDDRGRMTEVQTIPALSSDLCHPTSDLCHPTSAPLTLQAPGSRKLAIASGPVTDFRGEHSPKGSVLVFS
jgi:hypothetical protein